MRYIITLLFFVCFSSALIAQTNNNTAKGHVSGKGARKHREFPMAAGELTEDEFCGFLREAFELTASHVVDGATLFACMDWRHLLEILGAIRALGCDLLNLCVWVKTNGGMGSLYRSRHELVFVFGKGGATRVNNVQLGKHGRNRTNVWNYPGMNSFARRGRTRGLDLHPTVKPIAMVSDAILDVTQRGDIVLDPFCGSGTTILAAARTARRGYAIELDCGHVDTAIARWQRMTKQTAIHACGKTFEESLRLFRRYYTSDRPLPFLMVVTWNDYEEGTAVERGFSRCGAPSSAAGK